MDIMPKEHSKNVTRGEKVDLYTIAKIVNEISNKNLDIFVCEDGLGNEYTASNSRLICEIGDFDYTDIKQAIIQLYRWYEKNEKEISITKLLY